MAWSEHIFKDNIMDKIIGTVLWFATNNQSYGFIGYGKGEQVYVHYKGILKKGQLNPSHMTLEKDDVVEFLIAEGYFNEGTQAKEVEVIRRADANNS